MVRRQAGDTLVEVLVSMAVLGLVIVGAITLMNQGLLASQDALEHSQVRLSVTSQYEMLRKLRDEYVTNPSGSAGQLWHTIVASSNSSDPGYGEGCNVSSDKQSTAFYLSQGATGITRSSYSSPSIPAGLPSPGNGIWIEPSRSIDVEPPYMDFVIRACWQGIGGVDQRTVTAVRLYDPDESH